MSDTQSDTQTHTVLKTFSDNNTVTLYATELPVDAAQAEAKRVKRWGVYIDRSKDADTPAGVTVFESTDGENVKTVLTTKIKTWQLMRSTYGHRSEFQSTKYSAIVD